MNPQTHGATPQKPARDPRREQAERLRRIRSDYVTNAGRSRREAERYAERGSANWSRWSEQEANEFEADAAALLAGAAAIEAVEVAREALKALTAFVGGPVFDVMSEDSLDQTLGREKHANAVAALGRLEAL